MVGRERRTKRFGEHLVRLERIGRRTERVGKRGNPLARPYRRLRWTLDRR